METFARMREVAEIVIVCDPSWRDVFERRMPGLPKHIAFKWALPGAERQVGPRLARLPPDHATPPSQASALASIPCVMGRRRLRLAL